MGEEGRIVFRRRSKNNELEEGRFVKIYGQLKDDETPVNKVYFEIGEYYRDSVGVIRDAIKDSKEHTVLVYNIEESKIE